MSYNRKIIEVCLIILTILVFFIKSQLIRGFILIPLTVLGWFNYKMDPHGYYGLYPIFSKKATAIFYTIVLIVNLIFIFWPPWISYT